MRFFVAPNETEAVEYRDHLNDLAGLPKCECGLARGSEEFNPPACICDHETEDYNPSCLYVTLNVSDPSVLANGSWAVPVPEEYEEPEVDYVDYEDLEWPPFG